MKNCNDCGKPLNKSLYSNGLKSCPKCSVENENYHVFHSYPLKFGETETRATKNSPNGAQSHCTSCRANNPASTGTRCRDV